MPSNVNRANRRPTEDQYRVDRGNGKIARKGNKISTERYDIVVKKDTVRVYDRESKTWVKAWGDPHLTTGDGDKAGFTRDNLTLELLDGTKITIVPTEAAQQGGREVSWIDQVAIMNGGNGMVVDGVHSKQGPSFGGIESASDVDGRHVDGTVLRAGNEIDDLFFAINGDELVGAANDRPFGEHPLDGLGGEALLEFVEKEIDEIRDLLAGGGADGDVYSRLFAIMSRIDGEVEKVVDELEGLQNLKEMRTRLEKLEAKTPEGSAKIDGLKKEIDAYAEKIGAGENIEGRMGKLEFELQRMQNMKSQLSTMMSQLLSSDHQAKMGILRNIRN